MEELMNVIGTMSSLEIARITQTEHFNVLQKIDKLLESMDDVGKLNFQLTSYTDKSNRQSRSYNMNKTGSLVMIASYNVNFLTAVIERWQVLEQGTIPSYLIEDAGDRARAWAVEYDEKKLLQKDNSDQKLLIAEYTPKAIAFDKVIDNNTTYTLASLADISGLGRGTVADRLREFGWMKAVNVKGTESTQYAKERGYAKTTFSRESNGIRYKQFVLFRKGIDRFLIKI